MKKKLLSSLLGILFVLFFQQNYAQSYCDYIQVQNPNAYINSFSTSGGETNISNIDSGYSPTGYDDATDQSVSIYAGGTILFEVEMVENLGFNIWIDWNDDKVFDESEKVFASGTYYEFIADSFTVPADIPNGEFRMRIVGDWLFENPSPCGVNQYGGEAEDYTFIVVDAPSCIPPINVKAAEITSNSAVVSWEMLEQEQEWLLVYGLSGFDYETEGNQISVNNNPEVLLENLEAGEEYDVFVKTICEDEESVFQIPVLRFYTQCEAAELFYEEDFESANVPELPECTTTENLIVGNTWETAELDDFGFSSKVLKYKYSSSPADAWFFTNGIKLEEGVTYTLGYTYGTNMTNYTEKMKVTLSSFADAESVTEILEDHSEIVNVQAESNNIEFTVSETGVYYVGFNVYSEEFQDELYLDDIVIEAEEMSVDNEAFVGFSYYPNPVKNKMQLQANWTIESIKIFNLIGQEISVLQPESQNYVLNLENYSSGNYLMQVQINGNVKTFQIIKR